MCSLGLPCVAVKRIFLLALVALAACGGGSTQDDQEYLTLTAQSDLLSGVDVSTRIELGHDMCALLKKHHGDKAAAESDMAEGHQPTFTPTMMSDLRYDASVAYCPKYR